MVKSHGHVYNNSSLLACTDSNVLLSSYWPPLLGCLLQGIKENAMKIPTEVAWYSVGSNVNVTIALGAFHVAVCQTFVSGEGGMVVENSVSSLHTKFPVVSYITVYVMEY